MKVSKEELYDLYWNKGMSRREIASYLTEVYGERITQGQVGHWLEKYGIPRRSVSEAVALKHQKNREEVISENLLDSIDILEEKVRELEKEIEPLPLSKSILQYFLVSKKKNITVTVVISDLHIGDSNFLYNTWKSTIGNLYVFLKYLKKEFKIKKFNIVFNGDIVSGREIFRSQELQNIIQRGHWQVFAAEIILKDFLEEVNNILEIDTCYFVKGTHEDIATNLMLLLKRMFKDKAKYLSRGGIIPIGIKNELYMFVTHGFGSSDYYPVSLACIRDVTRSVSQYRSKGYNVIRVVTSHSHWLTPEMYYDVKWSVTGGFQKWEKKFSQRPSGIIVVICNDEDSIAVPIRPDPKIEYQEKSDPLLEYRNFILYGKILLEHAKKIERVEEYDET